MMLYSFVYHSKVSLRVMIQMTDITAKGTIAAKMGHSGRRRSCNIRRKITIIKGTNVSRSNVMAMI